MIIDTLTTIFIHLVNTAFKVVVIVVVMRNG